LAAVGAHLQPTQGEKVMTFFGKTVDLPLTETKLIEHPPQPAEQPQLPGVGFTGTFITTPSEPNLRGQTAMPGDRMLQYFAYAHLPPHLQAISEPFSVLAHLLVETVQSNPERTVALRKLLEAKDCAVRAVLFKG
jgi:hypothetical protein